MIAIRLLLFSVLLTSPVAATSAEEAWFAFGDLRGYIEPCGCDPRTDLGGIVRLGAFLARERARYPGAIVYDLGNARSQAKDGDLRSDYIAQAMAALAPTATLVNHLELSSPPRKGLPYLLSNAAPALGVWHRASQRVIAARDFQVYGYTAPERAPAGTRAHLWDWKRFAGWVAAQGKPPAGGRILLLSGPRSLAASAARSRLFRAVIASNPAPLATPPTDRERRKPERLVLYQDDHALVAAVPIGGQGVLRGGAALQPVALPALLAQPSATASLATPPAASPLLARSEPVTWLERRAGETSPLAGLMERYNAAVAAAFEVDAAKRASEVASSPYVGAAACAGCHAEAYAKWQVTGHAHALETLKAAGKDRDPHCVKCHVIPEAFVSEKLSPHFAGVQCENCHGPRREHIATQKPGPPATFDHCQSCHHNPHSPAFDREDYWRRIVHGREKAKR